MSQRISHNWATENFTLTNSWSSTHSHTETLLSVPLYRQGNGSTEKWYECPRPGVSNEEAGVGTRYPGPELTLHMFLYPLCEPWQPFQGPGQLICALSLPQISWAAGTRGQMHLGCRPWPQCHPHFLPTVSDLIPNPEILQPGLSGHWSS